MRNDEPPIPPGIRVLCVDDESAIGELVARILRRHLRCDVTTCGSGAEALRLIATGLYDAIIVDYLMPEMDGGRLYREILARHPELVAKLLFITGDTVSEPTLDYLRSTGRPLLTKPFGLQELTAALVSLLTADPAHPSPTP